MRILVCIPCVIDGGQLRRVIECVVHKPDVSVLIIDNSENYGRDVRMVLNEYSGKITVIQNPENYMVNKSWNQGMEYFLSHKEFDHLIIMNSDIIIQNKWDEVCRKRWAVNPDEILLPTIAEMREVETKILEGQQVYGGVAGIFITLNAAQVELVYPLPDKLLKVWYGDDIIFTICRNEGYKLIVVPNLLVQHEESSSVSKVDGIYDIIEDDKRQWQSIKHKIGK